MSANDSKLQNTVDEIKKINVRLGKIKKADTSVLLDRIAKLEGIVETQSTQLTEMKEEMKFRNMNQPEAELKIAKKYRLPILSKLSGKQGIGRWTRMLKVAGAVTSSTAGIKTLPLYGKKKKKKEEDEK